MSSFISMNMIDKGFFNQHSCDIRKWKYIKKGFNHFIEGDIAVAKIGGCFENRKSVIFKNIKNKIGACTTELNIIRPILLDKNYLLYIFKSNNFIKYGIKNYTGTAQKRVNTDAFKKFLLPIPPINEQIRISKKIITIFSII